MTQEQIGCCGAFCGTCPVMRDNQCKGCKTGYRTGERDLAKAKCKMKVCCIGKDLSTCADCGQYDTCDTLQAFYSKNGYKYGKYRQALEFNHSHGYCAFLDIASNRARQYGEYGPLLTCAATK